MNLPPRFLNWRIVDGRKVPCRADGTICNAHAPANHTDFATASTSQYGVAFDVRAEDGLFFLDMDKCRDDAGNWTAKATAIFTSFNGAWGEVSQSGKGLHIMGRCDPSRLADRRNKWDGWLEFYTDGRFVAFGGAGWAPIGGEARPDQDWTDQLLKLVPARKHRGELPRGVDDRYTGNWTDEKLIERMFAASGGAGAAFGLKATVRDLWDAKADILGRLYPAFDGKGDFDHSSADAALMAHLAFWTGKDMPRMDQLFRRSALMREKYEKRADYRRDTIQNAARLCEEVYSVGGNGQSADETQNGWEPLPSAFTQADLLPAPMLELAAFLPPALAQWIDDAAKAKSAPPDYVFFAFLSVSASLIGNARKVSPKPSWSQAVSIWPMCIGNPSSGKSPALDAVIDPLRVVENPIRKKAESEFAEWKSKKALADMAEDGWKKTVRLAFAKNETPPEKPKAMTIAPEPHMPRLMVSDCTIEKLATICAAQPKGILQFRDELSGWLLGMVRYSNSSDRPFWLEANGGRSYSVERVGRDTVTIPRLLINVLGGIQPDKLKSLLIDGDDDGLLARFIPVWPDSVPLEDHLEGYSDTLAVKVFERLCGLEMYTDEAGDSIPITRAFDATARKEFHAFRERLIQLEADASGALVPFLGKLPGLTATFSLLRGYIRWANDNSMTEPDIVSSDDVVSSIALAERYIIPMAQRCYSAFGATKEISNAVRLLNIIKQRGWTEFTQRKLQRTLGNRISSARELEAQIKELKAVDAVRETVSQTNSQVGRPSKRFVVNPYVYQEE
ncbi:phage NrS-1 polymerase family protein [Sedimentitalea todarodis]|uniref:DUF3987 domain-containing protein n=1 Tax=Sedimentitalea todarodis TaxID=1631240 RepID=A0ABU3V9D0_9RHOB|nr:DUF3987 domain-containing protein [Sedimentitalea todarodis]MDU9002764.1 DUF3987 domain-containing protein [Sedimentitalea todarodis]